MPTRLLLIAAASCVCFASTAQGDRLFDPSFIHEIRFETPTDDFFAQLENVMVFAGSNEPPVYLAGSVRIDGQSIDSVGVRIKGGISIFADKRPLKIDFNRFGEDREYDGIKKLNLLNAYQDPSFMRDALGYRLFQKAGVRAPRTAYARVYFNHQFHGLYVLVEQVDQVFVKHYFAGSNGALYKNKIGDTVFDSGDPALNAIPTLDSIVANLNGQVFHDALEQVLDSESFLRYLLVSNFIDAKDNYIDVTSNFYVYHDNKTGLLHWIPWDLNYAFFGSLDYDLVPAVSASELYLKMLGIPAYRERYFALACEMLEYLFVEQDINSFMNKQSALIRSTLETDPKYGYSINQFDSDVAGIQAFLGTRRQKFMSDLQSHSFLCPDFENPATTPSLVINEIMASNSAGSGISDPSGDFPDWIELYNNGSDTIPLAGFYLSDDPGFPKHWALPRSAVIAPGQYLVVWADRDADEGLWHASFKLAKSGGRVYLTFEDLTTVDSVSYDAQNVDVAWARYPNATGAFREQSATFGATNGVSPTSTPGISFDLVPNPAAENLTLLLPEANHRISLINAQGIEVLREKSRGGPVNLSVASLPEGAYFLKVVRDGRCAVRKVVVQRR